MDLRQALLLGACGGAIIEVVAFWGNVLAWREARRAVRAAGKKRLPPFTRYFDPAADVLALLTRVALGVVAGGVLREQVVGTVAAIMVGASAPALLLQLGNARSVPAVNQTAAGPPVESGAANPLTAADPAHRAPS